jgi:hypothetical protein
MHDTPVPYGIGQVMADAVAVSGALGNRLFTICGLSTTDLAKMRQKSQRFILYLGDSAEIPHKVSILE